jgi:hypothetical protein
MSWFGKAMGAVRAGRAEAHAATALYRLANLIPVIDRMLPAEWRPELASKMSRSPGPRVGGGEIRASGCGQIQNGPLWTHFSPPQTTRARG